MAAKEELEDAETAGSGSRRLRSTWRGVTGAIFLAAALATVATFVGPWFHSAPADSGPAPSLDQRRKESSDEQAHSVGAGECLASDMRSVVRCDAPHEFEVISTESCDASTLIDYLGGNPSVDILRTSPQASLFVPSGQNVCVVKDPGSTVNHESVKDVLLTDKGDAWRRCIDRVTGSTDVPCSEPHTGEYVLLAPSGLEKIDCSALAERYMDAPLTNFYGRLRVDKLTAQSGPECVVSIQGPNKLVASIREIGVSALPIQAG